MRLVSKLKVSNADSVMAVSPRVVSPSVTVPPFCGVGDACGGGGYLCYVLLHCRRRQWRINHHHHRKGVLPHVKSAVFMESTPFLNKGTSFPSERHLREKRMGKGESP